MELRIHINQPSLKRHLNTGGTFTEWRHERTNYKAWCTWIVNNFERVGDEYINGCEDFFTPQLIGLNRSQKNLVLGWLAGRKES